MDMREAFNKWLPGKVIECNEYMTITQDGFFTIWQAACEWQKQQDAEICRELNYFTNENWVAGTLDCAKAIRHQGKQNG